MTHLVTAVARCEDGGADDLPMQVGPRLVVQRRVGALRVVRERHAAVDEHKVFVHERRHRAPRLRQVEPACIVMACILRPKSASTKVMAYIVMA